MLQGYHSFRKKYALGDNSIMSCLADYGQQPKIMVVSCCDSRVDPALILQCDPGDLFVVRNVANIIPPYEKDEAHHGTSAALEFGICFLQVTDLILLGHSQCGGIQTLVAQQQQQLTMQNDFISKWVSLVNPSAENVNHPDECAKQALKLSLQNCLTFPWIKEKVKDNALNIHLWFFDVKSGQIYTHTSESGDYEVLNNVEEVK